MDKQRNSTFQFRINQHALNQFKVVCEKNGVKPSEVLRIFMDQYSNNNESFSEEKIENEVLRKKVKKDIGFSIGEMYCGPGGIGIAAHKSEVRKGGKRYGFNHSWATDYHKETCRTYAKNIFGDEDNPNVIWNDIRKMNIKDLPDVDGFLYGFPCNDFSNVGESRGLQGEYGPLYRYGVDYIDNSNPKFIFAENVSGLSNSNEGSAFKKIISELGGAGEYGYNLTTHLYKFEEYGVPQARHRIIIVGFRKDLRLRFDVPAPTKEKITSREALSNPPIPDNCSNQELTKQSPKVVERLRHIRPGENAWTADLPEHLKLNVKGAKLSMIYKRLDPDKPSYTVTGSGGGGTHMYHWDEPRALTNRERARLQTFPDDFIFVGSKESVRRQIGMAVPVKGAQIILEAILKTFAGISYESIAPSYED